MLLDIDDLKAVGEQSLQHRRAEVGKVRVIITDEIDRLRMERLAREVAPLVTSLRERAEELRRTELDRHASRLGALDPATSDMIDQITRALVNKLLHEPTVRLKDAAGSARGELYADALAALFALDDLGADEPAAGDPAAVDPGVRDPRARRRGVMRVATRASALARWQAERVAGLLGARGGVDTELVLVETTGDRRTDVPLHSIGGTGVFVKEVQEAVLDGRADVAVHSAKDLPAETPAGLVLGAIPERADPRDALVGSTLDALPTGAVVATGSVRRRAQLAALRPDLGFVEIRGNMHTRLEKAGQFDAIVVAAAALDRLGLTDRVAERLDPSVMLPQVAQGALAVECRADDLATCELLAAIDRPAVRRPVDAERAFLAELGGGCSLPVGAHATGTDTVTIEGLLATPDGRSVVRTTDADTEPAAAGRRVAARLVEMFPGAIEEVAR